MRPSNKSRPPFFGRFVICALALPMGAMLASAVPVTWTFQNVTWGQEQITFGNQGTGGYNPGGSLTGTFTFDADQKIYQCSSSSGCNNFPSWNITVSVPGFPSYTFTPATSIVLGGNSGGIAGFSFSVFANSEASGYFGIQVDFTVYPDLTDAGGYRSLGSSPDIQTAGPVLVEYGSAPAGYEGPCYGVCTFYTFWNSTTNNPAITTGQTTLGAPTNLQAAQTGNSGTQIQLTWAYGSDPRGTGRFPARPIR